MREYTKNELAVIRRNALKDGIYICKSSTGYLYIYNYNNKKTPYKVLLEVNGRKVRRLARTLDEAIDIRDMLLNEYGKTLNTQAGVDITEVPNVERYLSDDTPKPVLIMGYEGTKLGSLLFLNNVDGNYYIIRGDVMYTGTVKQAMEDQLTKVKELKVNPYIEYDNGVVVVYTADCKSFTVTKEDFETIKHIYWGIEGNLVISSETGSSLVDVLYRYDKSTQALSFGSGGELDLTPDNITITDICSDGAVVNEDEKVSFNGDILFPNIINLLRPAGYEGFFCEDKYLVLSYYKDEMYFARKRTDVGYCIVLLAIRHGRVTEYKYDFDTMPMARLDNKNDWSYIFTRKAEPVCIETKYIDRLKGIPELVDGHLVYEGTDKRLVNALLGYSLESLVIYVDDNPCNILHSNISIKQASTVAYCSNNNKYHAFVQYNGIEVLNQYFDKESDALEAKKQAERFYDNSMA